MWETDWDNRAPDPLSSWSPGLCWAMGCHLPLTSSTSNCLNMDYPLYHITRDRPRCGRQIEIIERLIHLWLLQQVLSQQYFNKYLQHISYWAQIPLQNLFGGKHVKIAFSFLEHIRCLECLDNFCVRIIWYLVCFLVAPTPSLPWAVQLLL